MYFKHKKRGTIYRVTALGAREADLEPMVSYVCEATGLIWMRPAKEFFDGRYEVFIPAPEAPGTGMLH
jgi:hypothetical protein